MSVESISASHSVVAAAIAAPIGDRPSVATARLPWQRAGWWGRLLGRLGPLAVGCLAAAWTVSGAIAPVRAEGTTLPDGEYAFGTSTISNHTGNSYLVFEARDGRVVGGFYWPYSEFECFTGTVESDRLNLAVYETYTQEVVRETLPLEPATQVAASGGAGPSFSIRNMQPLAQLGEVDRQVLNACRNAHPF